MTLINWFDLLNEKYGVKGQGKICYKIHGVGKTKDINENTALKNLLEGLKSERKAYIYHCYNHYMCPIGYEITPKSPIDAYSIEFEEESDTWILIADSSVVYSPMHIKKWSEI